MQKVRKITKKYNTLQKGLQNASLYWGHSSYVYSGFSEEYMSGDLLCGM